LPKEGELGLFNLINDIRPLGGRIIFSGNKTPKGVGLHLPDLESRLSWGAVFHLHRLNDSQLIEAFKLRAQSLSLHLPDEVVDFIANRQERDLQRLSIVLVQLMETAIISKRRITIPFVKEVLAL
jgi:DnaA family protein